MTADPVEDPIPLVIRALAFGGALGLALAAMVTWGVRMLQGGVPVSGPPSLSSPPALLLLLGTPASMAAAGIATWTLLAPIGNPWRRSMLGIIAGAGSFVPALLTWPVERALGRAGLLGLAALGGIVCVLIARSLSRRRPA